MLNHTKVSYQGIPVHEGMVVKYRNGKHSTVAPVWESWQEGKIMGIFNRSKPLKNDWPSGVNYFEIQGAAIAWGIKKWDEATKTYDGEEYLVHIPDMKVEFTLPPKGT